MKMMQYNAVLNEGESVTLEIEPIYLRNEVTWKKLPGRE